MKKIVYLLASFCFLMVERAASQPNVEQLTATTLFEQKPTPACHAATLVETKPNQLLAAWFGGSYEGAKDVGIYTAEFRNGAWSKPVRVVVPCVLNHDTLPCWNPVLFKSKQGTLYLFYKAGKNPREWKGAVKTSHNNGATWSNTQWLPEGMLGPIKNKPIETRRGTLICPSSTESVSGNQWRSHIELFDEKTNSWRKVEVDHESTFEVIQPTLLAHTAQRIQMLCRSRHNKVISAWSADGGQTWGKMDSLNLVNSNSGIDAVRLRQGGFLLVNNPLPQGPDWFYGRNVLDLEYSADGINWKSLVDLEHQEKGEFSYPAIIQTKDGKVHVLYTYNRERIKHVTITMGH